MLRPMTATVAIPSSSSNSQTSSANSRMLTVPGMTGLSPNPRKSGATMRHDALSESSCGRHSERSNGWPWIKTTAGPDPRSSYASVMDRLYGRHDVEPRVNLRHDDVHRQGARRATGTTSGARPSVTLFDE